MKEHDWNQEFSTKKQVYSVSQLNREVRELLESSFPLLWVEGEISNFANPSSGHWYFTLKDQQAQVRCAMFRNRNQRVNFKPENGLQVMIRARVGLYEGRGEFQLIAEHMEETGDGALTRAFEALKQKLNMEGLFDQEYKQALPTLPKTIGIITSPTGAAIKDMLSVLQKRFAAIKIIVYPASVQGENSANEIVNMIQLAELRQECDVLVLTRGGGSLEDLSSFNEEAVARAIFNCPLPVVSAVGHEIDFTIADFVADYRAPTPSAAAEQLSPDQDEWQALLLTQLASLKKSLLHHLRHDQQQLQHMTARLNQQHPGVKLKQWAQRIDDMESRYARSLQNCFNTQQLKLDKITGQLLQHSPANKLKQWEQQTNQLSHRLQRAIMLKTNNQKMALSTLSRALDAISPLATLDRGYSILQKNDKTVITDQQQVSQGEEIFARLSKGNLTLRVEDKN